MQETANNFVRKFKKYINSNSSQEFWLYNRLFFLFWGRELYVYITKKNQKIIFKVGINKEKHYLMHMNLFM